MHLLLDRNNLSSNPPPNSGKKQCYLQEHQPKTLWNLHQKLSRFVSCGPFSEAQLKKAHSAPDVHD